MKTTLFKGAFSNADALSMLAQMVHMKVKYHEDKIDKSSSEEDIKMRENRIKELQKDLYEMRQYVSSRSKAVELNAEIEIV